jgi:hypothetical protein
MFRKLITLGLLVSILSIASSLNVSAQTKMSKENQTVYSTKETKNEKLRQAFLKKPSNDSLTNFEEKDNLAAHQKQKKQGQKLSTQTKVLIGVGVGAAILVTLLVIRFGVNE